MKNPILAEGLRLLWSLIEVSAAIRCGIATFTVCFAVTHDFLYSIFTTIVVEGVFLASLFLIGIEVVAPVAALLALAFSGAMQYLELRVLDGSLTVDEKEVLRIVIAFAPLVILGVAYVRRLVLPTVGKGSSVGDFFGGLLRLIGLNRGESAINSIGSSGGELRGARSVGLTVPKLGKAKDRNALRRARRS